MGTLSTPTALSVGRFSTGMEKTGPNAQKDRVGRFSTGMETTQTREGGLGEVSNAAR